MAMADHASGGKVPLVTGGASGIGAACVQGLVQGRAQVVIAELNAALGEQFVAATTQAGGDARFVQVDVADPTSMEQMVAATLEAYDRLDIAVNNAGIGGEPNPTGAYSIDGWRKVIDINLNGVFYGMRYQNPADARAGGGVIVNMASILGSVGFATASAYVAAKHGVVGLTKAAAREYGPQDLRINAVGPGVINTPLDAPNWQE